MMNLFDDFNKKWECAANILVTKFGYSKAMEHITRIAKLSKLKYCANTKLKMLQCL